MRTPHKTVGKPVDDATGVETTGHEWDGIAELNTPLPRWWLWTFYLTIIWGIGYVIAYPAWPLVNGATTGVLGWSTRANVAAEIAAVDARNAPLTEALAAADLATVTPAAMPDVYRFAVNSGAALFGTNCSQCHGAGAQGGVGYPNLLDTDWLWGGTVDDIAFTVRHGIRNEDDPDARWSQMPAFGGILDRSEIAALVEHVLTISGQEADVALAEVGSELFYDNCAACHGDMGEGNRDLGAPALNDAVWLYGDDREALTATIANARFGVMPAWGARLDDADVAALAIYVHQLGGGEATLVDAEAMDEAAVEAQDTVPDLVPVPDPTDTETSVSGETLEGETDPATGQETLEDIALPTESEPVAEEPVTEGPATVAPSAEGEGAQDGVAADGQVDGGAIEDTPDTGLAPNP